jgi:hypothetical protein
MPIRYYTLTALSVHFGSACFSLTNWSNSTALQYNYTMYIQQSKEAAMVESVASVVADCCNVQLHTVTCPAVKNLACYGAIKQLLDSSTTQCAKFYTYWNKNPRGEFNPPCCPSAKPPTKKSSALILPL